MTTSTDAYAEQDRRAAAMGWTRDTGRSRFPSCPRRLVGKHCRNGYDYGTCWCSSRLNDHGDTWRDNAANRNERFVLWEPYGADGDELAAVIAAARADGLRVRMWASVWNPPTTVGIRFSRRADQ